MILKDLNDLDTLLLQPMTMIVAKTHTCSVCQTIVPFIQERVPAFDQFNLVEIYMDDYDRLKGRLMIFTVPTVLIYHQGKEILRESRFINTDKINRLIAMIT